MTTADRLAAYARFYETLTRDNLQGLRDFVTADVHFKDPFNDLRGADAMIRAMATMFDHGTPQFEVLDRTAGKNTGYLRWRYRVDALQGAASPMIDGVTEIRFDAQGRVATHIDHWDAASQLYEQIPVLGTVLRLIKRRFRTG